MSLGIAETRAKRAGLSTWTSSEASFSTGRVCGASAALSSFAFWQPPRAMEAEAMEAETRIPAAVLRVLWDPARRYNDHVSPL